MKPNSDTYQFPLGGETIRLDVAGRYIHIKEATGTVYVRFDEEKPIALEKFMGALDADGYKKLQLTSLVPQTITIIQANAPIVDARVSSSTALSSGTTDAIEDGFRTVMQEAATITAHKEKSLDSATITAIETAVDTAVTAAMQKAAVTNAHKEKSLDSATVSSLATAIGTAVETAVGNALTTYNAAQNP